MVTYRVRIFCSLRYSPKPFFFYYFHLLPTEDEISQFEGYFHQSVYFIMGQLIIKNYSKSTLLLRHNTKITMIE